MKFGDTRMNSRRESEIWSVGGRGSRPPSIPRLLGKESAQLTACHQTLGETEMQRNTPSAILGIDSGLNGAFA